MGLDDDEIADAMRLVVQQYPQLDAPLPSSVDPATTAMVQAMFLHALETCDGKLILEHVSIETIGVLFALERKLLYAVIGKVVLSFQLHFGDACTRRTCIGNAPSLCCTSSGRRRGRIWAWPVTRGRRDLGSHTL